MLKLIYHHQLVQWGPSAATMSSERVLPDFKEGGEGECSAQGSLQLQQKKGASQPKQIKYS
jgi:hypothetical protein